MRIFGQFIRTEERSLSCIFESGFSAADPVSNESCWALNQALPLSVCRKSRNRDATPPAGRTMLEGSSHTALTGGVARRLASPAGTETAWLIVGRRPCENSQMRPSAHAAAAMAGITQFGDLSLCIVWAM